jgi:hypothetical protein
VCNTFSIVVLFDSELKLTAYGISSWVTNGMVDKVLLSHIMSLGRTAPSSLDNNNSTESMGDLHWKVHITLLLW